MKQYKIINPYYIIDKNTDKKYNQKETCQLLNHKNRVIQMKNKLIQDLIKTNNALTHTIKTLEKKK